MQIENNHIKTSTCPISGYKIQESEDWIYRDLQSDYFIQVKLIGNNKLLFILNGFINYRIYKEQELFLDRLINQIFPSNQHFIIIHDYKNLRIHSLKIRREYINWNIKLSNRVDSLVFYNLSSILKVYIKAGILLTPQFKRTYIFSDYIDSITYLLNDEVAERYKDDSQAAITSPQTIENPDKFETEWDNVKTFDTIEGIKIKYISHSNWNYVSEETNFKCSYKLYEKQIILRTISGNQNLTDSIQSTEILDRIVEFFFPQGSSSYCLLIDANNFDDISYEGRRYLMKWGKRNKYRIKTTVYIGLSNISKQLIKLSRLVVKDYPVEFANSSSSFFQDRFGYKQNKLLKLDSSSVDRSFDQIWENEQKYIEVNHQQYKIIAPKNWEYYSTEEKFSLKIKCIDYSILVLQIAGKANYSNSKSAISLARSVIEILFGEHKTFCIINDYQEFIHASFRSRELVRNWFLKEIKARANSITITQTSLSINLAFKLVNLTVKDFKYYSFRSFDKALETLLINKSENRGTLNTIAEPFANPYFHEQWQIKKEYLSIGHKQYSVVHIENENIQLSKIQTSIINGHILLRKYQGTLTRVEQIEELIDKHEIVATKFFGKDIKPIIIYDLTQFESINLQARKATVKWMSEVFNNVEYFVYFGQNKMTRLAITLGKLISPKLHNLLTFNTIEESLEYIYKPKNNKKEQPDTLLQRKINLQSKNKKIKELEVELEKSKAEIRHGKEKIKDLFEILGKVSWDNNYQPIEYEIDENDVFSDIFNIVNMLQYDIQEIITEKTNLANKAIESEKLKSAFLANMSHEIRTPMNSIVGFSELLQRKENLDKESNQYLGIIGKNANQLLFLINDIIDFSKIEAGQIKLNPIKNNINTFIKDTLDSFYINPKLSKEEENGKVLLSSTLFITDDNLAYATFDEIRVRQILINLIQNAIKFTQEGEINVSYEIVHQFIKFKVKDTGIGIEEKKLKLIFERFQQANNSTTRDFGGTGLGLSICKGLCQLMGGGIKVNSELGNGSSFEFTIPYIKA